MTAAMDWLQEGRQVGATLDQIHTVIVVGSDPVATALFALGLGRAQAHRRRVAIGDLLGEAPPLQSLVAAEDPHGIVDSFLYGVSLNRVAYQVNEPGELFIMPSGTSPIDYEELFRHPRWRRLAAGFREVGALLVLAVPASAPHLRQLVDISDGAILVGDEVPGEIAVAQSLAWIRERRSAPMTLAATSEGEVVVAGVPPVAKPPRLTARIAGWLAGIVLTLLLGVAAFWFAERPFAAKQKVRHGIPATSTASAVATGGSLATDSAMRVDSIRRASLARDSAARAANLAVAHDPYPVLAPVNSADSAGASAYAVLLESANGLAGAILDLQGKFKSVPARSYALGLPPKSFYGVVSGAFPARASADSMLIDLRARGVLRPSDGAVVSLPYAFLVQATVPRNELPNRLRIASARAQPIYALQQPDGSVNLYFGAYESPQQAALAVPAVRKAGLAPTLVYRTGRVF